MGLDNYAARHPEGGLTEEDKQAFRDAGIDLCGGHAQRRCDLFSRQVV
jgi:hypothetical protein